MLNLTHHFMESRNANNAQVNVCLLLHVDVRLSLSNAVMYKTYDLTIARDAYFLRLLASRFLKSV